MRDNHINELESRLELVLKQLEEKETKIVEVESKPKVVEVEKNSYRAFQVADMTTFMAKLLQKMTEMSCNLANQFIRSSNELL